MKWNCNTTPWVFFKTALEGDDVNYQGYIVGSAVTLRIQFYDVITTAPVDPTSIILSALVYAGVTRISQSNTFSSPQKGTYVTTIDTTGFLPGVYTWRFLATDSSGDKTYGEDEFVLLPYTGPSGP